MRESSNLDTTSNLDNHLIIHKCLLALFQSIQNQTAKGVGLKREVRASATYVGLAE